MGHSRNGKKPGAMCQQRRRSSVEVILAGRSKVWGPSASVGLSLEERTDCTMECNIPLGIRSVGGNAACAGGRFPGNLSQSPDLPQDASRGGAVPQPTWAARLPVNCPSTRDRAAARGRARDCRQAGRPVHQLLTIRPLFAQEMMRIRTQLDQQAGGDAQRGRRLHRVGACCRGVSGGGLSKAAILISGTS